jgi:hypothetical protein
MFCRASTLGLEGSRLGSGEDDKRGGPRNGRIEFLVLGG